MPDIVGIARRVAEQAGSTEQIEAFVARATRTTARAYQGTVEDLTKATSRGIGIRVITDNRLGFAHAGSLDDDVVAETLAEARENAALGEPDEHHGLAAPDGVEPPDVPRWDDAVPALGADAHVDAALDLERRVLAGDPRVTNVRACAYGSAHGEAAIASSAGVAVESRSTSCTASVSALASDGSDTQIAGAVDAARGPGAIDVEWVAARAVERATRLLGATQPDTTRVSIVLESRQAATILGFVGGMLSGERVLKGRSPFADRVGDAIADSCLTITDDPTDPASLGADDYDGEGLAHRRTPLVVDGVLAGFLHNTYTGRRSGHGTTASAARGHRSTPGVAMRAMAVDPGSGTFDEIVAGIEHGFLVDAMTGLHSGVNPVSGDFSVGATGLMIRDGEVAEPVREATLASTLQRMLHDIRAVGIDLERTPGGSTVPTVVIGDIALSGA